ncbi:MAG: radical SAM protein [Clostridiales bacterium]|jgi:hypothetical protein|nr:radical SAM protein [Clostridiales bacterium]
MKRYAKIYNGFKREALLLRGTGCFYKKCLFCDYYHDASDDPFPENKVEIYKLTGEFGVLDVINSGSVHEIDLKTLELLRQTADKKQIEVIWFEAHYAYRDQLSRIRRFFPNQTVKFRTGAESFDYDFRLKMRKGMPDVTPDEIRRYFEGVCLLVGTRGQTKEGILRDVFTAARLFEYFSVNLFCPNSTVVERDETLAAWVRDYLRDITAKLPNCEMLIANTDLGLG